MQRALATTLATLVVAAASARAAPPQAPPTPEKKWDVSAEDYRLFCGYHDALERPEIAKLKGGARDAKIAKLAKLPAKKLMASVNKVQPVGATCDEVGKLMAEHAKKSVEAALPGRIVTFDLDYSDPSHVVAAVVFLGGDVKKPVQEAAVLARTLGDTAPISKTILVRAVKPTAPDKKADAAIWFEGKTSVERAANINLARVKDDADVRYIRLFDGIRCGADTAHETALGYKRGPCEGRTLEAMR